MPREIDTPWMTKTEVAEYAGLSERTILKAMRSGALVSYKPLGHYRFHRDDVDKWMKGVTEEREESRQAFQKLLEES